jgi:dTDP-4-amino-4,6-dideoxygalactose transaminase
MDLDVAERLITPASRVLLVQHTFGIPIDLDRASELARRRGLVLLEDCVHALGATYRGQSVGSVGRAAFFSTEETKTITSTMGGMAVTSDPELGARIRDIQSEAEWQSRSLTARFVAKLAWRHVLTQPDLHPYTKPLYLFLRRGGFVPGPTSVSEARGDRPAHYLQRLSNAQAALALRQLRRLEANVAHRNATASAYDRRLRPVGLTLTDTPPGAAPAYLRYPVWVRDREATVRAAASRAILGRWFTSVLEESARPEDGGYVAGDAPNAEDAARHLVNLPTHRRVRLDDIEAIARSVIATESGSGDGPNRAA